MDIVVYDSLGGLKYGRPESDADDTSMCARALSIPSEAFGDLAPVAKL